MIDKGREEELREIYSAWREEVLVEALTKDRDQYEEVALRVMREELKARGMDVETLERRWQAREEEAARARESARQRASEEAGPNGGVDPDAVLVVAAVLLNEIDAGLAKAFLESKGIPAVVFGDDCGGQRPHLQLAAGVRVMVREENLEAARKVLESQ